MIRANLATGPVFFLYYCTPLILVRIAWPNDNPSARVCNTFAHESRVTTGQLKLDQRVLSLSLSFGNSRCTRRFLNCCIAYNVFVRARARRQDLLLRGMHTAIFQRPSMDTVSPSVRCETRPLHPLRGSGLVLHIQHAFLAGLLTIAHARYSRKYYCIVIASSCM